MDVQAIITRLTVTGIAYFVSDIFIHFAIKKAFYNNPKKAIRNYWIGNITLFILTSLGFVLLQYMQPTLARINLWFFGIFISLLFSKMVVLIILFGETLIRFFGSLFVIRKRKNQQQPFMLSRRTFIARMSLLIGAIPFAGFAYGIFKGRYNFTIHKLEIAYDDLPEAFDGFTLTQLSDLHIGSWDKGAENELEYLVQTVQELKSDVVFFTGDIVNSRADEMDGWFDTFKKITAPFGVFSILGNHDYGDYIKWKTPADREENLKNVKNIHPQLGFNLLLNENVALEKNGEKIYVIGVENWGKGDFPKIGDLDIASKGVDDQSFRILLSHDPSHWDAKVLEKSNPPQLTLSGHTHGFQMGIETPAIRFSPSQFIYDQWAGLYQKNNVAIYVNRGLGTVGYPGRIGIWPEITQITLRKK